MYKRCGIYRATGVVLMDLVQDTQIQYSLFEDPLKAEKIRELYEAVDALSGHPFPRNGCSVSRMKEPSSIRRRTAKTGKSSMPRSGSR
jgi:hypothetical protein